MENGYSATVDEHALIATLERRNPWWFGKDAAPGLVPRTELRDLLPWVGGDLSVAICGMRRTGKTSLLRLLVAELLNQGWSQDELCLVDFQDPVFREHQDAPQVLDALLKVYRTLRAPGERTLLLLDEIQLLSGWADWVRMMSEVGGVRFVLTGSSSRVIEPELATVLTGRHISFRMLPLSFADWCNAHGDFGTSPSSQDEDAVCAYLRQGGLPGTLNARHPAEREQRLQALFSDILLNDVIERSDIGPVRPVRHLAEHLLMHTASTTSDKALAGKLDVPRDDIKRWLAALEESRLLWRLPPDLPLGPLTRAAFKVYAGDTGLRNAATRQHSPDDGHLAETAVFLHLQRHRTAQVVWWQQHDQTDRHAVLADCDFVLRTGDAALGCYQVWFNGPDVPARETRGLLAAMNRFRLKTGTIITRTLSREDTHDDLTIRYVPLHRWLREPLPPGP